MRPDVKVQKKPLRTVRVQRSGRQRVKVRGAVSARDIRALCMIDRELASGFSRDTGEINVDI